VKILRHRLLECHTLQRTSAHGRALVHKSVNFPLRRAHQIASPNQTETELGFFRIEQAEEEQLQHAHYLTRCCAFNRRGTLLAAGCQVPS